MAYTRQQKRQFEKVLRHTKDTAKWAVRGAGAWLVKEGVKAGVETAVKTIGSGAASKTKTSTIGMNKSYRKRGFGGYSTARYKGKFKKATKKGKTTPTDIYGRTGVINLRETSGQVADGDVVYITHSSFEVTLLAKTVAETFVRKLLTKAGVITQNPDEILGNNQISGGSGLYVMTFGFQTSSGYFRTDPLTISYTGDPTIEKIALLTIPSGTYVGESLYTLVYNMMSGNLGNGADTLEEIILHRLSSGVTHPGSMILLNEEYLNIRYQSQINIQNRTKSESGDIDAEAVDNQPLKGYRYQFKGGAPSLRTRMPMGTNFLNRIQSGSGVQLIRGAQFTAVAALAGSRNFLEPPQPKVFNNVVKATKVNMDPGNVKMSTIVSVYRGYANSLLRFKLCIKPDNIIDPYRFAPGKCEMYSLEERINTPSTNLITCWYEVQQTCAAMSKTVKAKTIVQNYQATSYSNIGP